MPGFTKVQLDEIDEIDDGRIPFRPIRLALGISTFGATAWTARTAGERLINEHAEDDPDASEELYVVVTGHATFELDGERHEAPAGALLRVDPGVTRTAFARDAGTTVLVIGGAPAGRPYQVADWERFEPIMAVYRAGEHERAADEAARFLSAEEPSSWGPYYNTACFEALAGRPEPALVHLRRAIELEPAAAGWARDDDDLVALRDRPEFAELVAE